MYCDKFLYFPHQPQHHECLLNAVLLLSTQWDSDEFSFIPDHSGVSHYSFLLYCLQNVSLYHMDEVEIKVPLKY